MHQYEESKTTYKKSQKKKRLIVATRNNTKNNKINRKTITRKYKWEEKNCIDILSDKLTTCHSQKPGHG